MVKIAVVPDNMVSVKDESFDLRKSLGLPTLSDWPTMSREEAMRIITGSARKGNDEYRTVVYPGVGIDGLALYCFRWWIMFFPGDAKAVAVSHTATAWGLPIPIPVLREMKRVSALDGFLDFQIVADAATWIKAGLNLENPSPIVRKDPILLAKFSKEIEWRFVAAWDELEANERIKAAIQDFHGEGD
jgi:hypothetical protein